MTRLERDAMPEPADDSPPSPLWRWLKIAGASTLVIFMIGVAAGFTAGHLEGEAGFGARFAAILAVIILILLGSLWLLVRVARRPPGEAPLTAKERLNRNILIGCGALGLLMSLLITFSEAGGLIADGDIFADGPLPRGVAILLVLVTGLLVPALSIYWHRSAVDEQEEAAYKTGALWAVYVYMTLTPAWWFAARGGFAPPVDGKIIYFLTVATLGLIWVWKKYR